MMRQSLIEWFRATTKNTELLAQMFPKAARGNGDFDNWVTMLKIGLAFPLLNDEQRRTVLAAAWSADCITLGVNSAGKLESTEDEQAIEKLTSGAESDYMKHKAAVDRMIAEGVFTPEQVELLQEVFLRVHFPE